MVSRRSIKHITSSRPGGTLVQLWICDPVNHAPYVWWSKFYGASPQGRESGKVEVLTLIVRRMRSSISFLHVLIRESTEIAPIVALALPPYKFDSGESVTFYNPQRVLRSWATPKGQFGCAMILPSPMYWWQKIDLSSWESENLTSAKKIFCLRLDREGVMSQWGVYFGQSAWDTGPIYGREGWISIGVGHVHP